MSESPTDPQSVPTQAGAANPISGQFAAPAQGTTAVPDQSSQSDYRKEAADLFDVVTLLDRSGQLRRAFADSTVSAESKSALVQEVLGNKISPSALQKVQKVVSQRWNRASDLSNALENQALDTVAAGSDQQGALDASINDLFAIQNVVDGNHDLQAAFKNQQASVESKTALFDTLVGNKVTPDALFLAKQAAARPIAGNVSSNIARSAQYLADSKNQNIAKVTTARELTDQQLARLQQSLSKYFGRELRLDAVVQEKLLGGIRIQVGDEVVDSSVLTRLGNAKRQLAS